MMVASTRGIARIAAQVTGLLLLPAALMLPSTARAQTMSDMPGMNAPAKSGNLVQKRKHHSKPRAGVAKRKTPSARPQHPMQGMPGMKVPMDDGAKPQPMQDMPGMKIDDGPKQQPMQDMPGMKMPMGDSAKPLPTQDMPGMKMDDGPKSQTMPGMNMPMDKGSAAQPAQSMPGMNMAPENTTEKMDMKDLPTGPAMTLDELEQMATSRNPTLAQVKADVRSAEGAKKQAGFYPNPIVGYYGDEIRGGTFRTGKEGAYISQTIVLGGKLGAARETAEQQRLQAVTNVDAQRYRVLNGVRSLYYEVLAAQRLVQLRRRLFSLASDAVDTSNQLGNVGQADRPDILQAEVEAEQAGLALDAAKRDYQSLWQALAATVGNPTLPLKRLDGNLEDIPQLDEQQWLTKVMNDSPQVKYAQQESDRANAALRQARKVPIPDIQFSVNVSQDNEPLEPSTKRTGIVSGAQIGIELPIFNRNQGNVEKAKADLERSQADILRVELELKRQMSSLFRDYGTARANADLYRTSMLPRAQKAYELYKVNYQNMAAAYPQVLIAQRTLFQLQVDYIDSLKAAWVNALQIQSYGLSDGLSSVPASMAGSSNSLPSSSSMSGATR